MNGREDLFEKYRRELMEMHRKATSAITAKDDIPEEPVTAAEEVFEEPEVQIPEAETEKEDVQEEIAEIKNEQTDSEPSVCDLCAGGIALCEFSVEDAVSGKPIEYAQILIFRNDGFFVRVLTDECGKTDAIPLFADSQWRVSITAQGYTSVSKAPIEPAAGEKTVIPVKLDESLSIDGIFAERDSGFLGA